MAASQAISDLRADIEDMNLQLQGLHANLDALLQRRETLQERLKRVQPAVSPLLGATLRIMVGTDEIDFDGGRVPAEYDGLAYRAPTADVLLKLTDGSTLKCSRRGGAIAIDFTVTESSVSAADGGVRFAFEYMGIRGIMGRVAGVAGKVVTVGRYTGLDVEQDTEGGEKWNVVW